MTIFKKKGSIIPKRFMASVEKKGQHVLKFGCDIKIVGNTIYPLTQGCVFVVPYAKYVNLKKNKGTNKKRWKGVIMTNKVHIDGRLCTEGDNTCISVDLAPQPFQVTPPPYEDFSISPDFMF